MFDEREFRKPEWQEGHWIQLADGGKWAFPKPRVRFRPTFVDGKIVVGGGPGFGPEYDETMDVLWGITPSDDFERLRVKFEVAVKLLRSNYELTDEQVSMLLVYEIDEPSSEEMFSALGRVVTGQSPKPLADTSVSP